MKIKEKIERFVGMPIEVETLDNGKYAVKIVVCGETDFLTYEELDALYKALMRCLDESDRQEDKAERRRLPE